MSMDVRNPYFPNVATTWSRGQRFQEAIQVNGVQVGDSPAALNPSLTSGTVYQNTTNNYQTLYIPLTYSPTSTVSATCAIALGSSSTPPTIFTNVEPAGLTTGRVETVTLRIPPQWYYSVSLANALLGTVIGVQE